MTAVACTAHRDAIFTPMCGAEATRFKRLAGHQVGDVPPREAHVARGLLLLTKELHEEAAWIPVPGQMELGARGPGVRLQGEPNRRRSGTGDAAGPPTERRLPPDCWLRMN